MSNIFSFNNKKKAKAKDTYTARDIEILEGLEPVRKRPGMYIGGTDETAMHHLIAEVLDNAMDEVVAGYADQITIQLHANHYVTIADNGRGIPVDNHPKFPHISALEVILTTLHSGGKFSDNIYQTAGGLHGVGISVVNALSDYLEVNVYKADKLFKQIYAQGITQTKLESTHVLQKSTGTSVTFHPDPKIFGEHPTFKPAKVYELAKAKAYLYRGVKINWHCAPELLVTSITVPSRAVINFPEGLRDYLNAKIKFDQLIVEEIFTGNINAKQESVKLEWAIAWQTADGFIQSYCNTIPTLQGGTHEQGLKSALLRGLKAYGEMTGNKKVSIIAIEDILACATIVLSIFIKDPHFQGQTKEKLVSNGISKTIDNIIKDHFDYWLSNNKVAATDILTHLIKAAELRINRRNAKNVARKTLAQKLKLPGKLADCTKANAKGTELFIVEGDSAGGSAKQARNRETQAVLPLRGKILNVASSTIDKIAANQEIQDLEIALSCGSLSNYRPESLRYEKIIIMTDADVDGAHIASLLMTFFYLRMPQLITAGHLYIAKPPLYRLTGGGKTYYAADEKQKNALVKKLTKVTKAKVEIGRFKGLGEMTASQLKATTMDPKGRLLLKVAMTDIASTEQVVTDLMGKKPEKRFHFIQSQALMKMDEIINNLDI